MMYDIIVRGTVEQTTEYPNYVKWFEHPGSFIVVNEEIADAILIPATELREEIYANIEGKTPFSEDFPTAIIQESGLPVLAGIDDYEDVINRLEGKS